MAFSRVSMAVGLVGDRLASIGRNCSLVEKADDGLLRRGAGDLMESGFGLAIQAFALTGLLGAWASHKATQNSNESVEQIGDIAGKINTIYKSVGSFSGISAQEVIDGGVRQNWVRNGRLVTPSGNPVTITSDQTDYGDGSTDHYVWSAKYPRQACQRMLVADFGNDVVNRTPAGSSTASGMDNPAAPMDPAQAGSICRQNGQVITLTFRG